MFNPSRDDARNFLFDSWRKHREGAVLTPLEDMVVRLIARHPEYHELLQNPHLYQHKDYSPEGGETNPFLHLMMHLTLEEQISIDQPHGVRTHFKRLSERYQSEHEAHHKMIECLGEMLWQSQRTASAPDASLFLDCLERF